MSVPRCRTGSGLSYGEVPNIDRLPSESKKPTKPGFYWALWIKAAEGTHEAGEFKLPLGWEVVEVWENFIGEPCEADRAEKFGVSICGVRETQWIENFKWGAEVKQP